MATVCSYNSQMVSIDEKQEDPRNTLRRRNEDNTGSFGFNCGGYALETFNWFIPIMISDAARVSSEAAWLEENGYTDESDVPQEHWDEMDQYINDMEEKYFEDLFTNACNSSLKDEYSEDDIYEQVKAVFFHHTYNTPAALELAEENMLQSFPDLRRIKRLSDLQDDEYGIIYRGGEDDFHFVKYDQFTDTFSHKMGWQFIQNADGIESAFENDTDYVYNSENIYFAKKRSAQSSQYTKYCLN